MDKLEIKRNSIRLNFAKVFNELRDALALPQVDVNMVIFNFNYLEKLNSRLVQIDEEIEEILLENDPGKYQSVYEEKETYQRDYLHVKMAVDGLISSANTAEVDCPSLSPANKRRLNLPKIELGKFGGDVRDWLSFWGQFSRIHEDKDIDNEDKFQYLLQSTINGSRAREIVQSYPATSENYNKAIDTLKNRFGREELLTEYYVRELLSLVVNNTSKSNLMKTAQLYDRLESHLRALESIGMTRDKYSCMLFPLVESCIPEDVLRAWIRNPIHAANLSDSDTNSQVSYSDRLQQLLAFLRCEVEGEERINMAKAGFQGQEHQVRNNIKKLQINNKATASDLFSGSKVKQTVNSVVCLFCEKSHESKDCHLAQSMTMKEKRDILGKKKACFLCFRVGHRADCCKSFVKCILCSRRHLTLMCPTLSINRDKHAVTKSNEDNTKEIDKGDDSNKTGSTILTSQSSSPQVLLQTLIVSLNNKSKTCTVRALLDCGSQRSYLLKRTADYMGYIPSGQEKLVHALFGGAKTKMTTHNQYNINVESSNRSYTCELNVLDQMTICGPISRIPNTGPWMEEIKKRGVHLTDSGDGSPEIELLIGADAMGHLLTGATIKLDSGLVAIETFLGWVVMGHLSSDIYYTTNSHIATNLLIQTGNLADLWNLDVLGITDPCGDSNRKDMEVAAVNYFNKTAVVNDDNRYEVMLPWVVDKRELEGNKQEAYRRLMITTSKLLEQNKFHDYSKVFDEWKELKIIKEVDNDSGTGYYLPHRAVFRESSTTTKIRPVFDASSKSKGNLSMNDCLEKGPNLIELIPTILLKFREKGIGVTADIEKAFLQISVSEPDCEFLKFLWWTNFESKTLKVYQHCRIVFGVNCSPFILGAVIKHHLDNNIPSGYCKTASQLKDSFYVDNCVTSVNSKEEFEQFKDEAIHLMSLVKFNLRDWHSTLLYENEKDDNKPTSVLGLMWDRIRDTLYCDVNNIGTEDELVTRRYILSMANKVFDPIGFTCPVTLLPKILLQESWREKISWDNEVTKDVRDKFLKWKKELPNLINVRIPRWVYHAKEVLNVSLHVFCDASKNAYSCVIFLRSVYEDHVYVQLLMAKSRVSPLKSITIPRLELMACCIGARLTANVVKGLNIENLSTYFWSDSTTALYWIKKNENWTIFVKNRVKEILSLTKEIDWNHVPGECNPADLPSRGCSVTYLLSSRWWEGPEWLKLNQEAWPKSDFTCNRKEIDVEKKAVVNHTLSNLESKADRWYLRYFSKYIKIVRMTAWILRFKENARKVSEDRRHSELLINEVNTAEKFLIRQVQEEMFSNKDDRKRLNPLCIFEDSEGLLRVKTKLIYRRDIKDDFKCPVVLPNNHNLVKLLIIHEHEHLCHAGVNITLTKLRGRFWILQGRRTVKKIISRCVVCRRHAAKSSELVPVPLPEDRIKEATAFEVIGIDLAGPLILKGNSKAWIVLFTCAVYRAIHLELIMSLSTNGFLLGFRRFIARRGRPKTVYSDNGTNFVGAANLFSAIDWKYIEEESTVDRIQWKFIPPTAAWWGGFWERMIQIVKFLLRRVLGRASLNYEEMSSILCDCESVINSRPLTYLSDNPNDLIPLSPAMFLQDNQSVGVPDLDFIDSNCVNINKRLKYTQKLRQDLRRRFKDEYLSQLVLNRTKYHTGKALNVGDIVIVGSDNKKRLEWPLARVIELYPGKDGVIRVAKVKTATGILIRHVHRLFSLELTNEMDITKLKNQEDVLNRENMSTTTRSGRLIKKPQRYSFGGGGM